MSYWKSMALFALGAAILASGCATKGFVTEEINKAKAEIANEQIKPLDAKIDNVNNEINKRITGVEQSYALKSMVEADIYKCKQDIFKEVDNKLVSIQTLMDEFKKIMEVRKFAQQEHIDMLRKDLSAVTNILWKTLDELKEGFDRAMKEIDKLPLPKPEGAPEVPESGE